MSITIELPQELESALSIKAKRFGVSLQEYLLDVLYASLKMRDETEIISQDEFRSEEFENESNQSVMARLRKIRISASPDFSMKVDLYEPEGRDAR